MTLLQTLGADCRGLEKGRRFIGANTTAAEDSERDRTTLRRCMGGEKSIVVRYLHEGKRVWTV